MQQELRQIRLPDRVRIEMMESPVIADQPVWPHLSQVILITLLSGFAAALAVVNALDAARRPVPQHGRGLQGRLGIPMLSVIHKLELKEAPGMAGLTMFTDPAAAANEAFRTLAPPSALATATRIGSPSPAPSRATARPPSWPISPSATRRPKRRRCWSSTPTSASRA